MMGKVIGYRLLVLGLALCSWLFAQAEIHQPITWSGERIGDSVRCTATIEEGWHMTLFALGAEEMFEEIHQTPYTVMIGAKDTICYNACTDIDGMCLAPEYWSMTQAPFNNQVKDLSLIWIFVLGFLGGLLAIFTPCVWPIIPMTVSFFLKRTDNGLRNAVLYGLSIIGLYVGLGLLVTIIFGASALNELSTNAVVNIVFSFLIFRFAQWCISSANS